MDPCTPAFLFNYIRTATDIRRDSQNTGASTAVPTSRIPNSNELNMKLQANTKVASDASLKAFKMVKSEASGRSREQRQKWNV